MLNLENSRVSSKKYRKRSEQAHPSLAKLNDDSLGMSHRKSPDDHNHHVMSWNLTQVLQSRSSLSSVLVKALSDLVAIWRVSVFCSWIQLTTSGPKIIISSLVSVFLDLPPTESCTTGIVPGLYLRQDQVSTTALYSALSSVSRQQ